MHTDQIDKHLQFSRLTCKSFRRRAICCDKHAGVLKMSYRENEHLQINRCFWMLSLSPLDNYRHCFLLQSFTLSNKKNQKQQTAVQRHLNGT